MVRDIVEIDALSRNSLPGGRQDPLDDDLPGGQPAIQVEKSGTIASPTQIVPSQGIRPKLD